jgi:hypothetical protein
MVTSKQLPNGSVVLKPRRRAVGGAAFLLFLFFLMLATIGLAGIGIFAPARLAAAQERALGLLHGGIVDTTEETFVDGCVQVADASAPQAITRTRRQISFRDGTSLEVVFSGVPAPTNACP